jgi:hypothetical protein
VTGRMLTLVLHSFHFFFSQREPAYAQMHTLSRAAQCVSPGTAYQVIAREHVL